SVASHCLRHNVAISRFMIKGRMGASSQGKNVDLPFLGFCQHSCGFRVRGDCHHLCLCRSVLELAIEREV
ncbi:hypothetical protein PENTCL1PPCAC_9116, partial [Pristionchus entomophagus]